MAQPDKSLPATNPPPYSINQPGQPPGWMPVPQQPAGVPGCPPGLEYLSVLDKVQVKQEVDIVEVVTALDMKNRYSIRNSQGQQCYFAKEDSSFAMRMCCGPNRAFQLHITDNVGYEVVRGVRPFKCCSGCCWCASGGHCSHEMKIQSPPGVKIGKFVQSRTCFIPSYHLENSMGKKVFDIVGPVCICVGPCFCCEFPFRVLTKEGVEVAKVVKVYAGFINEAFTQVTNFAITFPMDLDVKMKACLISTAFLLDMLHFERRN